MRPLRLLLTAFGPFPTTPENPTPRLARRVVERVALQGGPLGEWHVDTRTLPTEWAAPAELLADLQAEAIVPDVIVALGVSRDAGGVRVERWAVNEAMAKSPDAAGKLALDKELVGGAEERLEGLMHRPPFDGVVAEAQRAGHPVTFSDDAGRYLCNALFYRLLHGLETLGTTRLAGFVHVPPIAAGAGPEEGASAFREDTIVEALVALVVGWCRLIEPEPSGGEKGARASANA